MATSVSYDQVIRPDATFVYFWDRLKAILRKQERGCLTSQEEQQVNCSIAMLEKDFPGFKQRFGNSEALCVYGLCVSKIHDARTLALEYLQESHRRPLGFRRSLSELRDMLVRMDKYVCHEDDDY